MEASFSYTLSSPDACQQYPVGSNHLGSLGTDSDVDDDHLGHHSPFSIFYVDDRHHTRDRAETVSDPGRRDGENDVEESTTPPLT